MGKYFLGPDGDLLSSITLCCSVGSEEMRLGEALSPSQVGDPGLRLMYSIPEERPG